MKPEQELAQQLFPNLTEPSPQLLKACKLIVNYQSQLSEPLFSLETLEVLQQLNLDEDTYIATLLGDPQLEHPYPQADLERAFGPNISKLIFGIRKLNNFKESDLLKNNSATQAERLRQMLLAMTEDIRILLVKLASRIIYLRRIKNQPDELKRLVAEETQLIFAPLANRLGIAQLKWELEDLSFRYLEPQTYRDIAQQLKSKRQDREVFINNFTQFLTDLMQAENINCEISGRPKHIYSIARKMKQKNLTLDQLYDLRAVRIYLDNINDCYKALSIIHTRWNFVHEEFDDYITTPKENGYQSIHTVIIGPQAKTVEIQIRTHEMHQNAEQGIAAHWKYKEGGKYDASLEANIQSMRQMLEHRSDADNLSDLSTELASHNIYVLTPENEIISLPQGATALDFAYSIHSELGNRCRGAKVNGRIIPLTQSLRTGDRVEILAVKQGEPNRNWLNPNLGYLKTNRARTRVKHWFNKQNKDSNIELGEQLFNRELKRLHAKDLPLKKFLEHFELENESELYEALGKGQINERQIASQIQNLLQPQLTKHKLARHKPEGITASDLNQSIPFVVGAPNLKTHLAPCCQPQPSDSIIGFVTRGRGITIHKSECNNILNLSSEDQQRLIEVRWSDQPNEPIFYLIKLNFLGYDRKGLLRDIMLKLVELDINITQSNSQTDTAKREVEIEMELEVNEHTNLGNLLDKLGQIPNIEEISLEHLD